MPYFPKLSEQQPYRCHGCGGWFYPGTTSCCVAHGPGTCCHEYERPAMPHVEPSRYHKEAAARFTRLFVKVPLTDAERLPDPDYGF